MLRHPRGERWTVPASRLLAWLVVAGLTAPIAARADQAPHGPVCTGSVTLASEYVSRGFRLSYGEPSLQATVTCTSSHHWYVGFWGATSGDQFLETGVAELDLFGGIAGSLGRSLTYKVGATRYIYPRARVEKLVAVPGTSTDYDYTEVLLSLSTATVTANCWVTCSRDFFGFNGDTLDGSGRHSRGSVYLDLNYARELGSGFGIQGHLGRQWVNNLDLASFTDYRFGLTRSLPRSLSVGATVTWAQFDHPSLNILYRNYPRVDVDDPYSAGNSMRNTIRPVVCLSLTRSF